MKFRDPYATNSSSTGSLVYEFDFREGRRLPGFHLVIVLAGSGEVETKHQQKVRAGDAFFYRPDEWHSHRPSLKTGWTLMWVGFSRGINGVVVAPCAHVDCDLRDFPWNNFSAVAIGFTLRRPRLNMVTNDHFRTFSDIVRTLDEAGYQRIGCYLDACNDRRMEERARRRDFTAWFKRQRCDAVIVGDVRVLDWLRSAGIRVPNDVGVAHCAIEENEHVFAGMYHNCRRSGEAAMDLPASMIQRGEHGVPELPLRLMIDNRWRPNRTVKCHGGDSLG